MSFKDELVALSREAPDRDDFVVDYVIELETEMRRRASLGFSDARYSGKNGLDPELAQAIVAALESRKDGIRYNINVFDSDAGTYVIYCHWR